MSSRSRRANQPVTISSNWKAEASITGRSLYHPRLEGVGRRRLTNGTVPAQLPTPLWCGRSAEFLGQSDEKPFRPADVAEPIRVLIPDYLAYELGSALTEPLERLVYVVHGEHDAQVA